MARKTHNDRLDIPPLELECMKALWTLGTGSVHDVRATLAPFRPLAYTTVMTVMDRLARKGVAEREKRGRSYLYRPLVGEQSVRDFALERLTRNFFRGSREALRKHLEGNSTTPATASALPTAEPPPVRPAPDTAILERPAAVRAAPAEQTIDPSLL